VAEAEDHVYTHTYIGRYVPEIEAYNALFVSWATRHGGNSFRPTQLGEDRGDFATVVRAYLLTLPKRAFYNSLVVVPREIVNAL